MTAMAQQMPAILIATPVPVVPPMLIVPLQTTVKSLQAYASVKEHVSRDLRIVQQFGILYAVVMAIPMGMIA
jgi:hypothetical protein